MDFIQFRNLILVNCELIPTDDRTSEIHICPSGYVVAKDGREFDFSESSLIIESTKLPLLVDLDHASEMGGSTASAGWVQMLYTAKEDQLPGIWGTVEWTSLGHQLVSDKTYCYLSPTFLMDKDKRVKKLLSVALTNKPALDMTEIEYDRMAASYGFESDPMDGAIVDSSSIDESKLMDTNDLIVSLCQAMELDPESNSTLELFVESAANLRTRCTALESELVSARAELEAHNASAKAFEEQIQKLQVELFEKEVCTILDDAGKDGRIAPAQRQGFLEFCMKSRESFDLFKANILPNLPKVISDAPKSGAQRASVDPTVVKLTGLTPERIAEIQKYNSRRSGDK